MKTQTASFSESQQVGGYGIILPILSSSTATLYQKDTSIVDIYYSEMVDLVYHSLERVT